jgi:hypothetical protein
MAFACGVQKLRQFSNAALKRAGSAALIAWSRAYRHPEGTVAHELKGDAGEPPRRGESASNRAPAAQFKVVKPGAKSSPSSHQH